MRNTSLALLGCYSNLLGGDCLSYVGTEGADAFFGDGFDSGDASAPKFELAAVKLPAPDPASATSDAPAGQKGFNWGLLIAAAASGPAAVPVAIGVAIAEGLVVVEENAPRIESMMSELGAEAVAEVSELGAEASEFGSQLSELVSRAAEGIGLTEREAAAEGMQAHHIFPQAAEFAPTWENLGINIDEFRLQLSEGSHLGQIHSNAGIPGIGPGGLWNETWRQYIGGKAAAGRGLTDYGIFNQAATMVNDFGIRYYMPVVIPLP